MQLLYLRRYSTPWEQTGTAAFVAIARCDSGQGAATFVAKARRGSRYVTATYVGMQIPSRTRRGNGQGAATVHTYVAMARRGANVFQLYMYLAIARCGSS